MSSLPSEVRLLTNPGRTPLAHHQQLQRNVTSEQFDFRLALQCDLARESPTDMGRTHATRSKSLGIPELRRQGRDEGK
jgi:hypothetical protein